MATGRAALSTSHNGPLLTVSVNGERVVSWHVHHRILCNVRSHRFGGECHQQPMASFNTPHA